MDLQVRRSARLSPQGARNPQQNQPSAPAFERTSQTSSVTTTSYPSPTTDSERDQETAESARHLQYPPHHNHQPSMSRSNLDAPLPSPSAGDIDPFFGRPRPQPNFHQFSHSHHQHQQQEQQQATSNLSVDRLAHATHHGSFSQPRDNFNLPGVLPADFLAEAAKRAQMACLMRDLGDVSL